MTRMYIQPSWTDAASDHNQWSGGNGQYRGDNSADIATFDKQGRARVGAFSDEAIEGRKTKAKPRRSIRERILSQEVRLSNIEIKLKDLEAEKHTIPYEDYVQLKAILDKDYARTYELLERRLDSVNKPVNVKVKHQTQREILSENKRSALKAKQSKVNTENVKHDRKSLSKVADWLGRNDWCVFVLSSTLLFTAAKIIF